MHAITIRCPHISSRLHVPGDASYEPSPSEQRRWLEFVRSEERLRLQPRYGSVRWGEVALTEGGGCRAQNGSFGECPTPERS